MSRSHLTWRELLDILEGPGSTADKGGRHVEGCAHCRERLAQVRAFVDILREARLDPVPEVLIENALHRLGIQGRIAADLEKAAKGGRMAERLRETAGAVIEILAELVADSRRPSPALRGSAIAQPRMLRYRSSHYEITLSLAPRPGREGTILLGQILPLGGQPLPAGGWVELAGRPNEERFELSEFGEFRIEAPGGPGAEVAVHLQGELVRVPLPGDPV